MFWLLVALIIVVLVVKLILPYATTHQLSLPWRTGGADTISDGASATRRRLFEARASYLALSGAGTIKDAPAEIFSIGNEAHKIPTGANNCLFEAVIVSGNIRSPQTGELANPQLLREACGKRLAEENFKEIFDNGQVAGGECLWALSRMLNASFRVFKDGYGWVGAPIRHESVPESGAVEIAIRHVGNDDRGHWLPFSGAAE